MKFSTGPSSYLDNLVLADQYLAHVRSVLTQQGRWDSSVVIVMGDHSWRTALMWAKSPEWTKEEQAASQGARFDARPVYMIKMPGQNAGSRIDAPFSAIHTRSLLDAVFSDRLHNADGLQSWAARQH
jgi:arylsulfatase A-like enzyme